MNASTKIREFLEAVRLVQLSLAGIVGSMIITEWVASWDVVANIFKPDHVLLLSNIRAYIATSALLLSCLIGIGSIIWLVLKLAELKKITEDLTDKAENKHLHPPK